MSNSNKEQLGVETQEIHEKQIIVMFGIPRTQGASRTGTSILHQLGFSVITIIGVSPDEAQAGDIVVELMHNRFCTKAQV
jgi:hypothetical protein